MPTEVIMPALGMAQETGRLIAWLKNEGDKIERGDIIMEIETDKTTVELEAAASGTLVNVSAKAGEDVPVGTVIALILAEGETAPAPSAKAPTKQAKESPVAESPKSTAKSATPVAMRVAEAHGVDLNQVPAQGKRVTRTDVEVYVASLETSQSNGRILASPKARRLAKEHGYELAQIPGSGPDGAVLADDVLNFQAVTPITTPAAIEGEAQTGTMWRRMAERLTDSWQTIPHFYLKREVDATAMIAWRKSLLSRSDTKITFTDLLVKLVAAALKLHPHANGQWNGQTVLFNEQINVGMAVAVDEGLIVPVIHEADKLGMNAIAKRRQELIERVRNNKLQPKDLMDGTFTISNLGMYGIDEFSAIVNPPQAAILAVGKIVDRIVPVDGQAVVRPMMVLSLSCDHRAVDGARGAQFLDTLANYIAEPLSVLD